ncbi:hypothetical protein [Aeromicrobium sp. UC242_57]|uniref:hypothetical protein n=1 Tax=Aeromicrobium sp. UC242_57 TaxID=3374624 RepID=UPI0037AEFC10
MFKAGKFTMDPGAEEPQILPSINRTLDTKERCTPTRTWGSHGEILLGYHGGGCRYAVWAMLDDAATAHRTLFVDVHTVSGNNTARAKERKYEIRG